MVERPICLVSIGLIFGILGGQYWIHSRSPLFFVYMVGLLCVIIVICQRKERRVVPLSKGVRSLIFIGVFIGLIYGNWTIQQKYTWDLDQQEVPFTGRVVKREKKNGQEKYIVEITQLGQKKIVPKIQVQMQCKETEKEMFGYGSKIAGKGEWQEFSKARNEGTFDEKEYRKSQGITAKIICEKNNLQEKKQKKTWICKIKEERENFCAFLEERLGEKESAFASAIFVRRKKQVK